MGINCQPQLVIAGFLNHQQYVCVAALKEVRITKRSYHPIHRFVRCEVSDFAISDSTFVFSWFDSQETDRARLTWILFWVIVYFLLLYSSLITIKSPCWECMFYFYLTNHIEQIQWMSAYFVVKFQLDHTKYLFTSNKLCGYVTPEFIAVIVVLEGFPCFPVGVISSGWIVHDVASQHGL